MMSSSVPSVRYAAAPAEQPHLTITVGRRSARGFLLRGTRYVAMLSLACLWAGCAEVSSESSEPTVEDVVFSAAALGGSKPAVREIALVLDASGNLGPSCDWDPWQDEYRDSVGGPYMYDSTAITCDGPADESRWDALKRGLVQAIKRQPVDGSIAVSVTLASTREVGLNDFLGPVTAVPLTLLSDAASRAALVTAVQALTIPTGGVVNASNQYMFNRTRHGNCYRPYDVFAGGRCLSAPAYAWGAFVGLQSLGCAEDASGSAAVSCPPQKATRELCMIGDLAHQDPPRAYLGDWLPVVPAPARSWSVIASASAADRVSAINLSPGVVSPVQREVMLIDPVRAELDRAYFLEGAYPLIRWHHQPFEDWYMVTVHPGC